MDVESRLCSSFFSNSRDCIALCTGSGEIQKANNAFTDLFKLSQEYSGIHITDFISLEKYKNIKVLTAELSNTAEELVVSIPNEGTAWLDCSITPLDEGAFIFLGRNITEKKRLANRTLIEHEAFLNNIIHNLPIALQIYDAGGTYVRGNRANKELFNFPSIDYAIGNFNVFENDIVEAFKFDEDFHKAYKGETVSKKEVFLDFSPLEGTVLAKQKLILDIMLFPVFDATGGVRAVVLLANDISEQKKAEEEVKKQTSFIMNSPGPVMEVDHEGIILFANPEALDIYGGSIVGTNIGALWEHFSFEDIAAIENDSVYQFETSLKTGSYLFTAKRNKGRNISYSLYGTEITQLKNTEENLEKAQEIAQLGSWEQTLADNTVVWSDQMYRIFDIPNTRKIRNPFDFVLKLVHPDDYNKVQDIYTNHPRSRTSIEYRLLLPGGNEKFILEERAPIFDEEGHIVKIIGTNQDITEQKKVQENFRKAKQQAELANKAKSEFIANVSHEIRTPLSGILGITEMMMAQTENEDITRNLGMIKNGATSLVNIVNDILDISKIEAGKLKVVEESFTINELFSTLYSTFYFSIGQKGLVLSLVCDEEFDGYLYGDSGMLLKILTNLVDNAVKFSSQGTIEVNVKPVRQEENQVTLQFFVKDEGVGIAKEKFKSIFTKFEQAENYLTKRFEGTGLGLSICKHLVELLEGDIWLESDLGKGSTFYFTARYKVPIAFGSKKTPPPSSVDIEAKNFSILLVEDNPLNQQFLQFFLEDAGHEVITAQDGYGAIEAYKKAHFDLILMDIQMPEMDGITATKQIRQERSEYNSNDLPIIALTAFAMKEDKNKFFSAGMNDYLTKPVDTKELLQKIVQYTGCMAPVRQEKTEKIEITEFSYNNLFDLLQSLRNNKEALISLLDIFMANMPSAVSALEQAVKARDREECIRRVHSITNYLSVLRDMQSVQFSRNMEKLLREEFDDEFNRRFFPFLTSLHELIEIVKGFRSQELQTDSTERNEGESPKEEMVYPDMAFLKELYEVAHIGDIFGIEQLLKIGTSQGAACDPFLAKVKNYIKAFEIDKLISFLKEAIGEE